MNASTRAALRVAARAEAELGELVERAERGELTAEELLQAVRDVRARLEEWTR